jgi:hypothetical protein
MSADEQEAISRRIAASLEQAMAEAQHTMEAAEADEMIELAALAVRGIQVVRWRPPGAGRPVCGGCGRVAQWYQWVDTGCVSCRCALGD